MNEITTKDNVKIEDMIFEVRGKQVILASDVAKLYQSETKIINQVVRKNIDRFPESYCFQLTKEEYSSLRCNFFTLKNKRGEHRKYLPYAFTEYGITMLAGLLKSEIAVQVSIIIVDTFIAMKKYI